VNWEIKLPFRSKDASVVEIAECARTLDDQSARAVVRKLAMLLAVDHNCETVADALYLLDKAAPAERRRLLDTARRRAGLPGIGDLEEEERLAAVRRSAAARAQQRAASPLCHQRCRGLC
jgi:hypothetical protein